MKLSGSSLAAGIAGALVLGAVIAAAADKPQFGAWGVDLTAVDAGVKPGDDFNRYASGAWLDRTTIPADKPIASLRYLMSDLTEARLHEMLEAAAKDPGNESTLQEKIGGFFLAKGLRKKNGNLSFPELASEAFSRAVSRDFVEIGRAHV